MWLFGKNNRKSEDEIEQIFKRAQEHIQQHNYASAIEDFKIIRAHNTHDPRWMTGLGQCYYLSTSHQNIAKAYRLLNKACDLQDADAFYYLALLEESEGHAEKAFSLLQKAIRNKSILAMNYLGEIHFYNANYDQASNCFELAYAHHSTALAFSYLPQIYYRLGHRVKAQEWANLGAQHGHFDGINALGDAYLQDQSLDEAITLYERAIEHGSLDALNNLGLLHFQEKHYQRAERYFKDAFELHHIYGAHNLATVYQAIAHYHDAEKLYAFSFLYHQHMPSLQSLATVYADIEQVELSKQIIDMVEKIKQQQDLSSADKHYLQLLQNNADEVKTALEHLNEQHDPNPPSP